MEKDLKTALSAYEAPLATCPADVVALGNPGNRCAPLHDFAATERVTRKAIALDSTDVVLEISLATAPPKQGRIDEAEAQHARAVSRFPTADQVIHLGPRRGFVSS